jgi:hypothetical protein
MGFIQIPQKKRIIRRLARTKRLERIKREHREWLESQGLSQSQLKKRSKGSPVPFPDYRAKKKMPPTSDRITKMSGRAEAQQYSGERKLLGIAIMHKSNLVPVFDEESAKEISKMRRN